ncbi:unnamed protein product [Ascophyllum nodosum]
MGCKRVTVATAWAAAATCACCPFFQTRTTTAAFTIPTTTITRVTHRRPQVNISGQFSASSKARFRDHLAFNRKQVIGRRLYRPRAEATTRTSMVFGFGGGGGRGPRGPLGLEPGTLATIGFVILVLFAPGVILGVFNTLFLIVTLGPLLLSLGLNIYNRINSVDAPCPVCGIELQGSKNTQNQCPSCGTMLVAENGKFEALGSGFVRDEAGAKQKFSRSVDSGVIDVDVIDVED